MLVKNIKNGYALNGTWVDAVTLIVVIVVQILHDNKSKHLPFEKFDDAVRTMREFYANKQIRMSLTGGEPICTIKDIRNTRAVPKYGVDEVQYNYPTAVCLEKYQRALELIDNLIFSWHFEFLRVDHMKHVLSNLNRKQVKVHLMYLPGHLDEIKRVVDWLKENKVKFNVRRIRPNDLTYRQVR